ncbi:hypothetical protein GCM10023091_06420 [Ravibacter arvi]|uniref:histidine kinase n=1 Tax=Ravibacter arvi TaxID=2051041 RepID=A0ABP8LNR6_9BACT
MNFRLYQPPRLKFNFRNPLALFRLLFLVPLLLIVGLSIGFNRVNRHLTFYAAQVDNSQQVLTELSSLSTTLYEINFNILAHNAYGNRSNRDLALDNVPLLLGQSSRLDSLLSREEDQRKLNREIRAGIYVLYDLGTPDSAPDLTFFSKPGKLSLPNTTAMRETYQLIAQLKEKAAALMDLRLEIRNNYQSQLFRYNWLLTLVSVVFMAAIFYLLDGELLRNRKYRADLENKIENLNRSNNELEQFAYSASHDLQEPLRKIKSFSDRIEQKHAAGMSEESRTLLEKISSSAGRMQRLIHDLLAFSQLMRPQNSREQVALNKTLREVQSNLSLAIAEKNATITSDDLPTVSAYPSQMVQLFQNLLENALKYTKPGLAPAIGVTHAVVKGSEIGSCMPAHKQLDFHCITITDNGIGFAEEFAEKVFALFQRLHGRDSYEGTGIGLAICKRVVTNHNGYITARSIKGLGASFSFYLPVEG